MARIEGKSRSFWIGLICFVVVAAIIVGVFGIGTTGFKDWSFSRWFPKRGAEQHETITGGTVISGEESYGVALTSMEIPAEEYSNYGIDPQSAENAYNVTASFVPENTTFQEVDYSLYFDTTSKPEYATWAQGKNMEQYASVTQDETDSRKATVTFKSPFSAPIMIKATSRRNRAIFATIRADYVCLYSNVHLTSNSVSSIDSDIECDIRWEGGTIIPDVHDSEVIFKADFGAGFVTQMQNHGYTVKQFYYETIAFDDAWNVDSVLNNVEGMLKALGGEAAKSDSKGYWDAVCKVMLGGRTPEEMEGGEIFSCGFDYSRVYNGVTYSSFNKEDITITDSVDLQDWSGFEVRATNMGVTGDGGSSSIVMG